MVLGANENGRPDYLRCYVVDLNKYNNTMLHIYLVNWLGLTNCSVAVSSFAVAVHDI